MTSHPLLYEVHTRQWLAELGAPALDAVPDEVLAELAARGVTHLWLMGVWPTGPRSREQAVTHAGLRESYDLALPGWTVDDIRGSPYAVAEYEVAPEFGGDRALAALRARLHRRGIGVILDFVPNHTGLDHGWLATHPERFVSAAHELADSFPSGGRFVAHGKDPYFPGWTDTAQLEYRRTATRAAMRDALASIAERCDGVRCDMAMLELSDVFARTWQHAPVEPADPIAPAAEFWADAIAGVRRAHGAGFIFLAEAYWDLEGRLCDLGFDYAYDKHLYDLLVHDRPWDVQPHLLGLGPHTARRAHFLENHDEPRAAQALAPDLHRAAALLALGLPGLRFLHHGQLAGARRFARIQLGRRAAEPPDPAIAAVYDPLLAALAASLVGRGDARLLAPRRAWDDNPTSGTFMIVQWLAPGAAAPDRFDLVVVNLAPHRAQCRVVPDVPGLAAHTWHLTDLLGPERWLRDGGELATLGLFLDLPPRGAQLFEVRANAATI